AFRRVGPRELVARARVVGIDGDRLLEQPHGARSASQPQLDRRRPVERLYGVGVTRESLRELRLRLLEVAFPEPRPADHEVRPGVTGLELKAARGSLPRLRELGQTMIGAREEKERLAALRLESGERLESLDRLPVVAALVAGIVQGAERLPIRGVLREQRAVGLLRLRVPSGGHLSTTDLARKAPGLRVRLLEGAVGRERRVVVLHLEADARVQLRGHRVVRGAP